MKDLSNSIIKKHPTAAKIGKRTSTEATKEHTTPSHLENEPTPLTSPAANDIKHGNGESRSASDNSEENDQNKRMKKAVFEVDDQVKYFDIQSGKNVDAVITKVHSANVCMVGALGQRPFHMNVKYLTKQ